MGHPRRTQEADASALKRLVMTIKINVLALATLNCGYNGRRSYRWFEPLVLVSKNPGST